MPFGFFAINFICKTTFSSESASHIRYFFLQRLFKYIGGANDDDQKIAMTAPVVTRVTPGDG